MGLDRDRARLLDRRLPLHFLAPLQPCHFFPAIFSKKSGPSGGNTEAVKVRVSRVTRKHVRDKFRALPLVPKPPIKLADISLFYPQPGKPQFVMASWSTRVSDTSCCKPSIHPVGSGLRTSATQNRPRVSPPQRTSLFAPPNEPLRKLWQPRKSGRKTTLDRRRRLRFAP